VSEENHRDRPGRNGPDGPSRPGLVWAIQLLRTLAAPDMAQIGVPSTRDEQVDLLFDLMALAAERAKTSDHVPDELGHRIIAYKAGQDASRSWPSPRPSEPSDSPDLPSLPYPARANPVLDYLLRNTTHALLTQPETALSWLACTAWMEGHIEGYDRAMAEPV
jgi:hypothetical protein